MKNLDTEKNSIISGEISDMDQYIKSVSGVSIKTKGNISDVLMNEHIRNNGIVIKKNNLTFTPLRNGFLCRELHEIPNNFNEKYDFDGELQEAITRYVLSVKKEVILRKTDDGDMRCEQNRKSLGEKIFTEQVDLLSKKIENFTPFQKMLFWLGDYWWYYNANMRGKISTSFPDREIQENIVKTYLLPFFPYEIRNEVNNMKICKAAVTGEHFAILFENEKDKIRRIITDTQLFEIRGVFGYEYLDITPDGKPIARSRTERDGGRAFFDGERLMSHKKFRTCAPKTVMIAGGYKVNSTKCTIVNGMLCNLIDIDDKVAYTTGANHFLGMQVCDFSTSDALEGYKTSERSGDLMSVDGSDIFIGEKNIKPRGFFQPSQVKLQENGFSLYEWSDFYEIESYRYENVIVIDDKYDFLDGLQKEFHDIENLRAMQTFDKKVALEYLLKESPDAALLDMHLTSDESFDGLWIANQLIAKGYAGEIMIVSGYPEEQLHAMRKLIKIEGVHIPGKDMNKIRACLTGQCKC